MHPRQSTELSNPRALVSSSKKPNSSNTSSGNVLSSASHRSLVASRAQVEALDRDIAPILQRQKIWLMSSSCGGPLRISDSVVASAPTTRPLSSSMPLDGRTSSLQQLASTPIAPPSSASFIAGSSRDARVLHTSGSDRCASPHKMLLPAGMERPLTGRQQALRLTQHPHTNPPSSPAKHDPVRVHGARQLSSAFGARVAPSAVVMDAAPLDASLSHDKLPMDSPRRRGTVAAATKLLASVAPVARQHLTRRLDSARAGVPATNVTTHRPKPSTPLQTATAQPKKVLPPQHKENTEDVEHALLKYVALVEKNKDTSELSVTARNVPTQTQMLLDPDPSATTFDRELGLTIFSEGHNTRCIEPVYDRSNIAQYWLTKAKNMDEFLSARIQLSSSDALRDKVATSVKTVEALLEELNAKKITSREERYHHSMKEAVDKIIYEVSRRHLIAAEKAKKDADDAEEEERRLAEEEDARQRRIRNGGRLQSVAKSDESGDAARSDEPKDDEDQGSGSGADNEPGDDEAAAQRQKNRILFNNRKRQAQLRKANHMMLDVDEEGGGGGGGVSSFHSNLQTILEAVEAHTDTYHQLMEDEQDDDVSFFAIGDGFDGDSVNGGLMYSIRRPSAFETDPFALASERAAKAGFMTAPGGQGLDRSTRSSAAAVFSADASSAVPTRGLTAAAPAGGGAHGGVSSFLNDRSRSFTAGGTCVLPGSITKSFHDVPTVAVTSTTSASASVNRSLTGTGPAAASRGSTPPYGETILDSEAAVNAEDGDDGEEEFMKPLQTADDVRRIEEATCLERVAQDTLRSLKVMETTRTFPAYLHLQEHPELRPPPHLQRSGEGRPKEDIDVSVGPGKAKDAGGADDAAIESDGQPSVDPAVLARMEHSAGHAPFEDPQNAKQQQQQRKQKRALDLNNLAKYGEAAKAAADGSGGLHGALSFTSGAGSMAGSAGGPRSPRFAMEQNYGVKGVLIEQGSIDGSHDALFGFYGSDPFEIPGIYKRPDNNVASVVTPAFLGSTPQHRARPVSPVSPGRSPTGSSSSPPKALKSFYTTIRYWVTNLSTTDILALYITIDPKKMTDYAASPVDALKAPNRPNSYVARVFPMTMVQIAMFEYTQPQLDGDARPSNEDSAGMSGRSDGPPVAAEPVYHLNAIVLKREKRGANDRSDGADSDTLSQQRSGAMGGTPSGENSFAHMPSDAFPSRRASRQSLAIHRTGGGGTNGREPASEQVRQQQAAAEKDKQDRADKLRQAMAFQQRKNANTNVTTVPAQSEADGKETDGPDGRPLKGKGKAARNRRLSTASNVSVATTASSGGGGGGGRAGSTFTDIGAYVDDSAGLGSLSRRSSLTGGIVQRTTSPQTDSLDPWKASHDTGASFVPKRKGKTPKVDDLQPAGNTRTNKSAVVLDDGDVAAVGKMKEASAPSQESQATVVAPTVKAPTAPPGGKLRKRGASRGGTRRARATSVTLVTETSPLFSADGIEATVTTEDEFIVPREGEELDEDDDEDELSNTAEKSTALSARRNADDDPVDEEALYEALFADDADTASDRDRRTSSGSVRSGLGVSVDSAGSPHDGDPTLDGSQKGSPDAQGGRRYTESFQTVENLMAQRRHTTSANVQGGSGTGAEEVSPAKRALMARKSVAMTAAALANSNAPQQGFASPGGNSSLLENGESFESGPGGFGSIGDASASFSVGDHVNGQQQPTAARASAFRPQSTGHGGVEEELANVLSTVGAPRAAAELKEDRVAAGTKKSGGGRKKRGGSTASRSPPDRSTPQSLGGRQSPSTTIAQTKIFAVAERADRKNAILEGVLRSAAEQDAIEEHRKKQRASVSPRQGTLLASPSTHPISMPASIGGSLASPSSNGKSSFASHSPIGLDDNAPPSSAEARRGSASFLPPPVILATPKFGAASSSFASSSSLDTKTPRGTRSATASPLHASHNHRRDSNGDIRSPTFHVGEHHDDVHSGESGDSTAKTFTEVIRERLEDLAAKVAGEGLPLSKRPSGASAASTTPRLTSPVATNGSGGTLPTVDDVLAGTELQSSSMTSPVARSRISSATSAQQQRSTSSGHGDDATTIPTANILGVAGGSVQSPDEGLPPRVVPSPSTQVPSLPLAVSDDARDNARGLDTTSDDGDSSSAPQHAPGSRRGSATTQIAHHGGATDRELRLLFEEDPDAFSDVITDLAESAAARIMQEYRTNSATDDDDDEVRRSAPPSLRPTNPTDVDTPPPPSDQLVSYRQYIPPPAEDPEVLRRQRAKAQRLLAEQQRLDALVAEIVGQVSKLWPTVQQAPSWRRAEFFQTSMEVAWRAQKKRAINVGKLISMLDRKVSTRGWYPRYDHRDELREDSDDDDASSTAEASASDGEGQTIAGSGGWSQQFSGVLDTTNGGDASNNFDDTATRHPHSNLGAPSPSSKHHAMFPRPSYRRRAKRGTGGAMIGRRRGSATTLHRALSEIAAQHREELAVEEQTRAVHKEQQARLIQEQGHAATVGGGIVGSKIGGGGGARFRSHRFTEQSQEHHNKDALGSGIAAPPRPGWAEAEGVPMPLLLVPDYLHLPHLPLPSLPPVVSGGGGGHRHYQVVHVPKKTPVSVGAPQPPIPTLLLKSQAQRFGAAPPAPAAHGSVVTFSDTATGSIPVWYNKWGAGYHDPDAPHNAAMTEQLPHQLLFGEVYPRHALEEPPVVPSSALAHARIQAIRKHRLTYHLALRTGVIRN